MSTSELPGRNIPTSTPGLWRPIDEAPKDETPILIGYEPHVRLCGLRRVYEARWHEAQGCWTSMNGFLVHAGATHYMPLPDPPRDTSAEAVELLTAENHRMREALLEIKSHAGTPAFVYRAAREALKASQ